MNGFPRSDPLGTPQGGEGVEEVVGRPAPGFFAEDGGGTLDGPFPARLDEGTARRLADGGLFAIG